MYSEHPTCSQCSAQSVRDAGYAPSLSLQNVVLPAGAGFGTLLGSLVVIEDGSVLETEVGS